MGNIKIENSIEYIQNKISEIEKDIKDIYVPTKLSEMDDDVEHRTVSDSQIQAWNEAQKNIQSDWNEQDTNSDAYIKNKPQITNDLTDELKSSYDEAVDKKHTHSNMSVIDGITYENIESWNNKSEFDGQYSSLQGIPNDIATETYVNEKIKNKVNDGDLATVAKTGSYNDLNDTPTSLPASDVYQWAKEPEKPSYTASEVGADATGTAESKVSDHNVSDTAHNDIRLLIEGLTTRLNALADSDDTTLDQMGEVVAYIKSNRSMISSITTDKVNVTSIVNDLTTNVANKPLSAAQGVALKALIDEMNVPASTTADNGKVLSVVDGTPSWTTTSSEQAAISAANAERSATIAQECAQAMAGTFDFTGYLRYQVVDAAPETYEKGVLHLVTNS